MKGLNCDGIGGWGAQRTICHDNTIQAMKYDLGIVVGDGDGTGI